MLNQAITQEFDQPALGRLSGLVSRNVTVGGRRTSIRLEPSMWDSLRDLCRREHLTINELCTFVAASKSQELSLTASLRILAVNYFREAATEEGHMLADHGRAALKGFQHLAAALHRNRLGSATP